MEEENGFLNCWLRYFNKDGEMFSSYSDLFLGSLSMINGISQIRRMWKEKSLPNLVKEHYPRYIHVEMVYGKDMCHDGVFLLDFSEEIEEEQSQ